METKALSGLHWTNAVVFAIATTMAVMMSVVCLLYGIYLDEAPRLREQWPLLVRSAVLFTFLAVVAGGAFYGLLRDKPWRWPAQGVLALTTVLTGWLLWKLLVA